MRRRYRGFLFPLARSAFFICCLSLSLSRLYIFSLRAFVSFRSLSFSSQVFLFFAPFFFFLFRVPSFYRWWRRRRLRECGVYTGACLLLITVAALVHTFPRSRYLSFFPVSELGSAAFNTWPYFFSEIDVVVMATRAVSVAPVALCEIFPKTPRRG